MADPRETQVLVTIVKELMRGTVLPLKDAPYDAIFIPIVPDIESGRTFKRVDDGVACGSLGALIELEMDKEGVWQPKKAPENPKFTMGAFLHDAESAKVLIVDFIEEASKKKTS